MKRIVLAAIAVIGFTSASQADPFASVYGNTVTQVMADGTKIVLFINADKTWEQHIASAVMKGTYDWKDDTHACFTHDDPAPKDPAKATNCYEVKDHKVGDTWTEATPDGKTVSFALTAGR